MPPNHRPSASYHIKAPHWVAQMYNRTSHLHHPRWTPRPKCNPRSTSRPQVLRGSVRHCLLTELSRCSALPTAPFPASICWLAAAAAQLLALGWCHGATQGHGMLSSHTAAYIKGGIPAKAAKIPLNPKRNRARCSPTATSCPSDTALQRKRSPALHSFVPTPVLLWSLSPASVTSCPDQLRGISVPASPLRDSRVSASVSTKSFMRKRSRTSWL